MSARNAIAALLLSAGALPAIAAAQEAMPPQFAQSETQSYDFQPLNSGEGAKRGITRSERETVQNYVSGGRGSIAAWQSSLERLPPRRDEAWAVSGYNLLLVDRKSGSILDVWHKVFEPY